MSSPPPIPFRPPRWLLVLLSAAVSAHLFIVLMNALGARNGPWPGENGQMETSPPPKFAGAIREATNPTYLRALKLTDDYHFASNMPDRPGVDFEARLKDDKDEKPFPDPAANAWVRHYQRALARGLFPDERVVRPTIDRIAAQGTRPPTVITWTPSSRKPGEKPSDREELQLQQQYEHLVADNGDVWGPTTLARILSRSYARYLCRVYDAESAQVVRRSRRSIVPSVLTEDTDEPLPADVLNTLRVNFGEVKP